MSNTEASKPRNQLMLCVMTSRAPSSSSLRIRSRASVRSSLWKVSRKWMTEPTWSVSQFIEDEVFSGPAKKLIGAIGNEPSTAAVAEAYPFVDAFFSDTSDTTDLDKPVTQTSRWPTSTLQ